MVTASSVVEPQSYWTGQQLPSGTGRGEQFSKPSGGWHTASAHEVTVTSSKSAGIVVSSLGSVELSVSIELLEFTSSTNCWASPLTDETASVTSSMVWTLALVVLDSFDSVVTVVSAWVFSVSVMTLLDSSNDSVVTMSVPSTSVLPSASAWLAMTWLDSSIDSVVVTLSVSSSFPLPSAWSLISPDVSSSMTFGDSDSWSSSKSSVDATVVLSSGLDSGSSESGTVISELSDVSVVLPSVSPLDSS